MSGLLLLLVATPEAPKPVLPTGQALLEAGSQTWARLDQDHERRRQAYSELRVQSECGAGLHASVLGLIGGSVQPASWGGEQRKGRAL